MTPPVRLIAVFRGWSTHDRRYRMVRDGSDPADPMWKVTDAQQVMPDERVRGAAAAREVIGRWQTPR